MRYFIDINITFYSIFLIDHAWTYRGNEAREYLTEVPGLVERMLALMDIQNENCDQEQLIERILQVMWKFNGTYSLGEFERMLFKT